MWKDASLKGSKMPSKGYSPSAMITAYNKVKQEGAGIRSTAREFGIPEASLRHRLTGYVNPEATKPGPPPLFSQEEEAILVEHLKFTASVGYGYSRAEVVAVASEYAVSLQRRTTEQPLTFQWYTSFMSRWPELKIIKPRGLQIQRARSTSVECVEKYYQELHDILVKYDLLEKPERIFNVDEKGLSTSHKPPQVIAATGSKPAAVTSASRMTVTVLGCGSAIGQQIPPYFIFPGVKMRQELMKGKSAGADGDVTESGWSNSVIFRQYLENHLSRYLPSRSEEEPILLSYDGHRSHISLGLTQWAKENHIILFVLPAHTSHVLQPMDVACFGPFERIYNNECHKFMRENCGASITKYNICKLACKAYKKALCGENLESAFRKAGIYPYDDEIIDRSEFLPSTILTQASDIPETATTSTDANATVASTSNADATVAAPGANIFQQKEAVIRQQKPAPKKRNYLSTIVSGRAITEDAMQQKIVEHQNRTTRRPAKTSTSTVKSALKKTKAAKKMSKPSAHAESSPVPGPSAIHIAESATEDSSMDDSQDEKKCCVCNKFRPEQLRNAASLIFTKWVQCDNCPHWVHLIYCTTKRVVRRRDTFLCPHCHEE